MFVSGIDPRLATPFSITTILISVPFAVIIFAMILTLWGGSVTCPTPMLFTLGALATFILGGVTGIFNGSAAFDIYIHDTYFVVAHFHYTLFPVTFLAGFAGIYFWFPKMFGRMMSENLGKLHFWLTFVFFNAVFTPQFLLGLGGHMRRIYDPTFYEFLKPLQPLNVLVTVAAFVLIAAQLSFVVNFVWSLVAGPVAAPNPWQANTLEWTTASPPPHENFARIPVVHRGAYEYSRPDMKDDWLPQDQPGAPAPGGWGALPAGAGGGGR
jgi:cytochrome c oxidase subunit 1